MKTVNKVVLMVIAMVMIAGLIGCGNGNVIEDLKNGLTLDAEITMPEEYQITYEKHNIDATISTICCAKDAEGNIYFQNGDEKIWFMREENGYVEMQLDANGVLIQIEDGVLVTDEYVAEATEIFLMCVQESDKALAPGFELVGEQVVAGRTCDVYENKLGIENMNVTYSVLIDRETGICMGWQENADTGMFESNTDIGTFICTEFVTEGVELPEA